VASATRCYDINSCPSTDKNSFDIVGLQEVAFTQCDILETHFNCFLNTGEKKKGTAFLVREDIVVSKVNSEPNGRLIKIKVGGLTLINVYAPSEKRGREERSNFLKSTVPAYAHPIESVVIFGEFNSVDDLADRSATSTMPASARIDKALVDLIASCELVDVWKKLRGSERGHTFVHTRGSSRIDRFLTGRSSPINFQTI